jgi:hypothetical protein
VSAISHFDVRRQWYLNNKHSLIVLVEHYVCDFYVLVAQGNAATNTESAALRLTDSLLPNIAVFYRTVMT